MSETHKEHPSPTKYVQIAIVLAILTAIEGCTILHRRYCWRSCTTIIDYFSCWEICNCGWLVYAPKI